MFLNFIIKCFEFTSMIVKNSLVDKFAIIFLIGPIVQLTGMTMALFESNDIRYSLLVFGYMLCVSWAYSLQILYLVYQTLLIQIKNKVLSIHQNHPDFIEKQITLKIEQQTERKLIFEILLFIFSSSLCVFCPLLYFFTEPGIKYDHPDVQVIPFYYPFWHTNSIFDYTIKKFFEFFVTTTCLGSYYIFTSFLVYTITSLKVHIEEINRQFGDLIDAHTEKYLTFGKFFALPDQIDGCFIFGDKPETMKDEYEKSIDREFAKIIQYYNYIHSFTADVTKFLHKPMTALFAWYISSTVLFTYAFFSITDDFIYIMKMLSLVIHGTVALRLFCNISEIIHHLNEKMMDSFYNTSWYYLLPKSRKNLLIILSLCQRKYEVKCFGMYVVNLNLFLFAVRMVYSVMNILLMKYK